MTGVYVNIISIETELYLQKFLGKSNKIYPESSARNSSSIYNWNYIKYKNVYIKLTHVYI